MHTVEFADIQIRAALPLHPYLYKHSHLFLRLVADGSVCGDTAGVDGDLASGIWEFNARLYASRVEQSLNVAVLTGAKGPGIRVVSVTIKVTELLAREKGCPNRHQYIVIFDSCAAIQLKLVVTCSIKLSSILGRALQAVGDKGRTINRGSKSNQSDVHPAKMDLLSREDLETLHATTTSIPDWDESKAPILSLIGHAYHTLYLQEHGKADLEQAISNHEEAMQFTGLFHPHMAEHAHRLSVVLLERLGHVGDHVDIERAISYSQIALRFTENFAADKPAWLCNLGSGFKIRFERLKDLADIENSISCLRQAVELTPDGHPHKPDRISHLGLALRSRFERLYSLVDMEEAISNFRKVVELTPDGHPNMPGRCSNLGTALRSRFEHLGNLPDLEDAISSEKMAVELAQDGHPDKAGWLSNLGAALHTRFSHFGSRADLEDGISNFQKAAELVPGSHPSKPWWLSNLETARQIRFINKRLGSLVDLENGISNFRKAVEPVPDGHPNKPWLLSNLGTALHTRFERFGNLADLDDAILNEKMAVELAQDGHPDKPWWLSNLGTALRTRFERLGSLSDVDESISNFRKAVELTPDGHPERPSHLQNLGISLLARFRRLRIVGNLESALSALSTAANSKSGSVMVRFKAARSWAMVAEDHSRSPLDAFGCAIDLLPRVAWLGLAVTDQHALLADVGGIVRDAVAAAIRYEEYETAVVWAEQGRSIVWKNLLGLRGPVDDLREAYPEVANRLQNIAGQLEGSESHELLGDNRQTAPVGDVSRTYSKLAVEWDNLIDEIRKIPKFEGFLRAKSFSQLATAAHEGPVVILNVNGSQCDALVLNLDNTAERHVSVLNIPLERFSYGTSKKLFHGLTDLLSSAGVRERSDRKTGRAQSQADGETKFKTILRILWQDVVKPVIEGLNFPTESKRPPHIWWCATGLLAFLPIHAAGLYDTSEIGEKVSDYVVSSYTPTLNAILKLSDPTVQDDFQVLTVAQASAPGAQPIPKTEDEVRIIQGLTAGVRRVSLMGKDATLERVRKEMTQSNWIHLACHGKQNSDNPMESGFLLHDRMLKLSEIVKMSLPKTDFAFLSACQTAMGDEKVAEESVHLAAGMLLSGCRGVIATTWSIRDEDGPKIAEDVYGRIFKDGKPTRKEVAYALHEAVKRLRESGAKCTSWVPFIHIGR